MATKPTTTPQNFFEKNMRWIALVLLILLMFKFIQGCNRNMGTTIREKQATHIIDSLNTKYQNLEKESTATVESLKFELKLQSKSAEEADKRANAVQSVAEKVRANTTVNVRGAERDTITRKK
jgi:hypothetical protein